MSIRRSPDVPFSNCFGPLLKSRSRNCGNNVRRTTKHANAHQRAPSCFQNAHHFCFVFVANIESSGIAKLGWLTFCIGLMHFQWKACFRNRVLQTYHFLLVLEHFWKLDLESVEITVDVEQNMRGDTNGHQAGSHVRTIFALFLLLILRSSKSRLWKPWKSIRHKTKAALQIMRAPCAHHFCLVFVTNI